MRLRTAGFALAALVAVGSVACGSSSTTGTASNPTATAATTTAVTKGAFLEQANGICTQLNADTKALGDPISDAEAAQILTKGADLTAAAVDKIKALPQPTEDSAGLQQAYTDIASVLTVARKLATALDSGNQADAKSLASQLSEAGKTANASANAYGLTECGKSGSSNDDAPPTTVAGSTTTTSGGTTTKAAFLAKANGYCADMNDKLATGGQPSTNDEAASLILKSTALIDATVYRIKALPQPTEDAEALQQAYTDIDAAIALGRELASAYASGDEADIKALGPQVQAAQTKANASANAYGLSECGKGS